MICKKIRRSVRLSLSDVQKNPVFKSGFPPIFVVLSPNFSQPHTLPPVHIVSPTNNRIIYLSICLNLPTWRRTTNLFGKKVPS